MTLMANIAKMFSFLFCRLLQATHAQIGHAATSAVNRIRALMEAHAQSYATTPSTSSTAHVRQLFTANFVRSGEPCLAKRNSEEEDIPSLVCIICLIQRLILCMKPFVILRPRTDLFGPLSSLSAWLTSKPLKCGHFLQITLSTKSHFPGKCFDYLHPG